MCNGKGFAMKCHIAADVLGVTLLAALLACITGADLKCEQAKNGTIKYLGKRTDKTLCWNVTNGSYMLLEEFSLIPGDFLVIYNGTDGKENMITNMTGKHANLMVYAASVNNTVVFTRKGKSDGKVSSQFTLKYSSKAVQQNFTGISGQIQAPVYKTGRGYVESNYMLNVSSGASMAVSLSTDTVNITSSSMIVSNSSMTLLNLTGNVTHFHDVFSTEGLMFVKLNLSTVVQQNFSAAFTSTTAACTRKLIITKPTTIQSPGYPTNYAADLNCRWLVQSSQNTTIKVKFSKFRLADSYDHVILVDGDGKEDETLGVFNKLSPPGKDFLLTSGNSLWLHFGTDESLSAAGFSLSVEPVEYGGRFVDSGVISLSPPDHVQNSKTAYFQLTVPAGNQVYLNFSEMQLVNSSATVTCYNSLNEDMTAILATFSNASGAHPLPVFSSDNKMLVVASNFFRKDSKTTEMPHFNASFTTVSQDGLLQTSLSPSGTYQLTAKTYPSQATWVLPNLDPRRKSTGVLALKIASVILGRHSRLTVYEGTGQGASKVAEFNSSTTNAPVIYVSSARVVYSTTGNKTKSPSTLVRASYSFLSDCGGNLSKSRGVVTSPLYPDRYPLNANCTRRLLKLTSKKVHVALTDLALASNHGVEVLAVSIKSVKNQTRYATKVLASYSSNTSMPTDDLIVEKADELWLRFQSRANGSGQVTTARGFQASYENLQCGGLVRSGGEVKTPGFPTAVKADTTCVWIISLPVSSGKKPRVVSFKYQIIPLVQNDSSNTVEIRDGASTLSETIPVSVAAGKEQQYSTSSKLWIRYTYHQTKQPEGFAFKLTYKTYDCVDVCDNGMCMQPGWKCNNISECSDGSDENGCVPPPGPSPSGKHGGVSVGWFVAMIFIMFLLGIGAACLAPIAYRRFRTARYRELHDMMTPAST